MFGEFINQLRNNNLISADVENEVYSLRHCTQEELIDLLSNSDDKTLLIALCRVLSKTAFILHKFDIKCLLIPVIKLLDSSDYEIRLESTILLGYLDAYHALETLLELARNDTHDCVKIMVIHMIARWRIQETALPLIKIALNNSESIEVRVEAIEALGMTNSEYPLSCLFQLLEHPNVKIRSVSILSLHNLRKPIAIKYLEKLLGDNTIAYNDRTISDEAKQTINYLKQVN